jgi:hypothetical protein
VDTETEDDTVKITALSRRHVLAGAAATVAAAAEALDCRGLLIPAGSLVRIDLKGMLIACFSPRAGEPEDAVSQRAWVDADWIAPLPPHCLAGATALAEDLAS